MSSSNFNHSNFKPTSNSLFDSISEKSPVPTYLPLTPSKLTPAQGSQDSYPESVQGLSATSSIWPTLQYLDPPLDYWALEYVETPLADQLTCSICQCVFVEPYSTKCGHTFCKKCLLQALEHESCSSTPDSDSQPSVPTSRCPIDRNALSNTSSDIWPAPVVISNLANDLVVYCPNKARGCSHKCQRWLLGSHLQQSCMHAQFKCEGLKDDGSSCNEPLEKRHIFAAREMAIQDYKDTRTAMEGLAEEGRSVVEDGVASLQLSSHEKESDRKTSEASDKTESHSIPQEPDIVLADLNVFCPHEEMECTNSCGATIPRYMLAKHMETSCHNYSTQCPVCGLSLMRKDLPQHLDVCPETVISCTAAEHGCVWIGKRSQFYSEHQRQCKFIALAPALNKQSNRISKIEQENKALRYQLDQLITLNPSSPSIAISDMITSENTARSSSSNTSTTRSGQSTSSRPNGIRRTALRFTESDFMHVFMEGERLRDDVDRLNTQVGEMDMRHGMTMMQESFRTSEEINALRNHVNSLRHQIHFLLADRRSWAASMQQLQFQQQQQHMFPPPIHSTPGQQQFPSPTGLTSVASTSSAESLVGETPRRLSDTISRQDVKL